MLDTTNSIKEESGKESGMKTDDGGMKSGMENNECGTKIEESGMKSSMNDTETTNKTQKNYQENQKTTKKILILLTEKPNISMREIAKELNLTNDGVIWQIKN